MTRLGYISTVSALYMVTFFALFLIAGAWAAQPAYETIPIAVTLSLFLAWIGTERVHQIMMTDRDTFTLPSIMHGCIISVLLGIAIYARISGKGL